MSSHVPRTPFAPLVLIVLSACSSPTGEATQSDDAQPAAWQVVLPDAAPFTTRTELPENGAVALQGQAHTAHVRLDPTQSGLADRSAILTNTWIQPTLWPTARWF